MVSPQHEILFQSPDGLVTIVKKTSGLKRWPPHKYPCIIYILRPRSGTRVQSCTEGVEFMMTWNDLREFLRALEPGIEAMLPKHLTDKPAAQKALWKLINEKRREENQ